MARIVLSSFFECLFQSDFLLLYCGQFYIASQHWPESALAWPGFGSGLSGAFQGHVL